MAKFANGARSADKVCGQYLGASDEVDQAAFACAFLS
jgi:hypothetical protein